MNDHTSVIILALWSTEIVCIIAAVITIFHGKDPSALYQLAATGFGALAGLAQSKKQADAPNVPAQPAEKTP
jgi:hypothetical protein